MGRVLAVLRIAVGHCSAEGVGVSLCHSWCAPCCGVSVTCWHRQAARARMGACSSPSSSSCSASCSSTPSWSRSASGCSTTSLVSVPWGCGTAGHCWDPPWLYSHVPSLPTPADDPFFCSALLSLELLPALLQLLMCSQMATVLVNLAPHAGNGGEALEFQEL